MASHPASASFDNKQLGDFLRSRRRRLNPNDVGLPAVPRRRNAGLRREEVAQLAGISTEWYVKLEQGRSVSPSDETIQGLAQALRLSETERRHLFALAKSVGSHPFMREVVPDALRAVVEALSEPAYITGRRFDVLAWNEAAVELLADFGAMEEEDRNILAWMLLDRGARTLFDETWQDEAKRIVSLFRTNSDLIGEDPAFRRLIDRVTDGCPDFATWWTLHDVEAPRSGAKQLNHPLRGTVHFIYSSFQANDDPTLKLALYIESSQRAA
jgi:transcriptional regulator with XRE-family HTH domain